MKMEECDVCGKESNYNGCVYYEKEYNLCQSHYLKFCRYVRTITIKYKNAKPRTEEWDKMCKEKGDAFDKWFKEQKLLKRSD